MAYIGQKIKFDDEVQRYTVQACSERYAVMTKPFNARKTFLYTITDYQEGVRGSVGWVFGTNFDLDTPEGAQSQIDELINGAVDISYRNRVPLSDAELIQLEAMTPSTPNHRLQEE